MRFIPAMAIALAMAVASLTSPAAAQSPPQVCPSPIRPGQTPPPTPVLVPCPTPAPGVAPLTVPIPGEATLASPGGSVIFRRPTDGASLTVSFAGALGPATLTYDGTDLTVRVPPLGAFEFLIGGDRCARVDDQSHVLRCAVQPTVEGERVAIAILYGDPIFPFPSSPGGGLSAVSLQAGCNNIVITFPGGTPVDAVARSIIAPGTPIATRISPEAVWKFDAGSRRFLGWSPLASSPDDFSRVNRLDALFVCIGTPAQLVQPALRDAR